MNGVQGSNLYRSQSWRIDVAQESMLPTPSSYLHGGNIAHRGARIHVLPPPGLELPLGVEALVLREHKRESRSLNYTRIELYATND